MSGTDHVSSQTPTHAHSRRMMRRSRRWLSAAPPPPPPPSAVIRRPFLLPLDNARQAHAMLPTCVALHAAKHKAKRVG